MSLFRVYKSVRYAEEAQAAIRSGKALGAATGSVPDPVKSYFDRLLKLIPSEVVALYTTMAGIFGTPPDAAPYLIGWSIFCLIVLILIRASFTKGPLRQQSVQWKAVAVSVIAYILWLYNVGGPFNAWPQILNPRLSLALIVGFVVILPFVYRGDDY
jgi:hypothetical protein